jgi:DNA-binding MarR family transcriptional regulator
MEGQRFLADAVFLLCLAAYCVRVKPVMAKRTYKYKIITAQGLSAAGVSQDAGAKITASQLGTGDARADEQIRRARGLMRGLRRTHFRILRLIDRITLQYQLSSTQYLALLYIVNNPGLIQKALAEELDSDPNTISSVVRKLCAKKLIKRIQPPSAMRAIGLFATREGILTVRKVRPQVDKISMQLLAQVPAPGRRQVDEWLAKCAAIDGPLRHLQRK